MTVVTVAPSTPNRSSANTLFITGILIATLTDAIASTVLSIGRNDIIGDIYATPDQFAWLDIGYTAPKLIGFMAAPWFMARLNSRNLLINATLAMGAACGIAAITTRWDLLIALRALQGLAGAIVLVAGQTSLFLNYPRAHQPILQALFAVGAVVAPATIAPILQGWLIDNKDWTWIFFSVAPMALVAVSLLLVADAPQPSAMSRRVFDWTGLTLISISFFSLTYVFSEGSRWRWFEEPHVIWLSVLGAGTLLTFLGQQMLTKGQGVLDFGLFQSDDFCFALVVSVVAGAALLGSAYLIPSFAVAVLAFRPTDAGLLLLPSGALFVLTLLIAAYLIQARRVRPIATVPAGILIFMIAMWMLSGSTSESGAHDMTVAVLLRGLGLGFLFLSINLIAFSNLSKASLAYGIGLFSVGRQLGGLAGVGALQTLIDHNVTNSLAVLGARITVGTAAVNERLTTLTVMLTANGMDAVTAGRAAMSLLSKSLFGQSTVIAFDTAFSAVALLFVVAAPLLVSIKIGLARCAHAKSIP